MSPTKEKIHWRKMARVCPKCHKLKPAGRFICELDTCVECSFDNAIWKEYKCCIYCRKYKKAEEVPTNICKGCLQAALARHHKNKGFPKLVRGQRYVCVRCNVSKLNYAYAAKTSPQEPLCNSCISIERIAREGKFRCRRCASVFPQEEMRWNMYCSRCQQKKKAYNLEYLKEYRKNPRVRDYHRAYSRHYWHNIVKPIYNKTIALQWMHGYAKKRKVNRNGYWYMLNRSLFEDFKKRPRYWYAMTSRTIETMQKGRDVSERLEKLTRLNGWRPPPPMF